MDLQLKGANALVTGGTKGIGRAIAERLTDEGCNVSICARNEDEVNAAVEAFKAKGVNACGLSVDVGDGDALKGWVEASAEVLGGIDCVVSNVSGGNAPGEAGWRANFEHDVLGSVRLVEAALPHLEQSDNASIIMISSTAALEKFIGASAYNAMKGAVVQYSGALAQDVGAKGIRVNSICPGPIFIEGGSWDMIKQNMTPFYDATVADIPVGRMGSAEEVAAQIALLASPLGAFTTGCNVVIDGGFTKRIQF
ncbi:MAG: 3-ketoacyl-ACP reductase [Gammaproteobacteria bacterium]|mgnify:CR=1 FL=1|nr:3-ketoacyl-ACP reductase [Gammaproteobacteria bacterium]|tara:strand:+ start:2849 stop:3607 length:759 start_codon:yes stop_codon:yes gene_type:complete